MMSGPGMSSPQIIWNSEVVCRVTRMLVPFIDGQGSARRPLVGIAIVAEMVAVFVWDVMSVFPRDCV